MITNFIIRKAEDITIKNEITDFSQFFFYKKNISAISFEIPNEPLIEFSEKLFKQLVNKIGVADNINMIAQLYPQPNNRIIRYKNFWGILRDNKVNTEAFSNKSELLLEKDNRLIVSGIGKINMKFEKIIPDLLLVTRKLYFYTFLDNYEFNSNLFSGFEENVVSIISKGGLIFFFLGDLYQDSCEIVVLSKITQLNKVLNLVNAS
ncbi:hypothetical protein RYD26_12425 [Pasteurellaceae bacterium LIM206]|nr:hypothetical protein [Pasteurellaceae bacterium LIM206]